MLKTLARSACSLTLMTGIAFCAAEEKPTPQPEAPKENPLKQVKPVEGGQVRLGDQIHKTSDAMRDLLEDLQQNTGVDLNDKDHVKLSTTKLDTISTTLVGQVVDSLIAARKGEQPKEGLKTAMNGQDQVIKELRDLLRRMKNELNPNEAHRLLSDAIKKQEEAIAKTKDTRVRKELDGKPADKLNEEEKKALAETNEKQKEATEELKKALSELKAQTAETKKEDPKQAEALQKTQDKLAEAKTEQKSADAQNDIADAKLRAAEQKENEVLAALKEADKELAQTNDKLDKQEQNLADLKKAREKQAETKKETQNLDTKNDKAVADAAKDQGEVSKALEELKKDNPPLNDAGKKSDDAAAQIGENKPQEATQNQEKVLNALDEAIKKAEQDLANAQNQTDNTAAAEDKLGKIQDLKVEQKELKKQTDAAKADNAAPLAPKENALADKAADIAKTDPPPAAGQPDSPLADAQKAMNKAAKDLANQDPKEAGKEEQKALAALDKAEAQALADLAKADPAAAEQAAANAIGDLQKNEQALQDQNAQGDTKPAAAPQAELGNEAKALAESGAAPEAAQPLEQAAAAMAKAAQALEAGQQAEAAQAQAQAQAALAQAAQAVGKAMAALPQNKPDQGPPPPKSESKDHQAGKGNFTFGKTNNVEQTAWNVMLPPKERDAVEQASKSRIPAKYARQVKLYYLNMANAKAE